MIIKRFFFIVSFAAGLFIACNSQAGGNKTNLSATEFAAAIKSTPSAPIVDVRTPTEFGKGHLKGALNFDWNGNAFDKQVATLDKNKPVLVYCLSGGRSAAAAMLLRKQGFREVLELEGGIMKWRAANLPETTDNTVSTPGMSRESFNTLVNSDKYVLVDFYADWCAPCKKMKPYLDEIASDMSQKVSVQRINADDNQSLCKELKVDALPVLQLYKGSKLIWSHSGYIDKATVLKQLK